MNEHDWARCPDNDDGRHRPVQGPYDPELNPGFLSVECDGCGQTTGVPIPPLDSIDWG